MIISIDATTLLLPLAAEAPAQGDTIWTYPLRVPVQETVDHERSSASRIATQLRLRLVQFCNVGANPIANLILTGSDRFHASQHIRNLPKGRTASATIFDLSCWTTPQYHTEQNMVATRQHGERVWKHCAGLIAISGHARRDAMEVLQIPGERIRVIYPGIAERFFSVTPEETARARRKYSLTSPYILYVGCIEPRKNIRGLISAYKGTSSAFQRDIKLVIAGPLGWERGDIHALLTGDPDHIVYLSYVPETDLPGLFGGATAFVYPSYYEGFGLPVAQAMACGAPVICSNRGSLPEIVQDAGIYVDPDSPEQLSAALEQVAGSSESSRVLAGRGKARAAEFRWDRCAVESLRFFHDL
jgi:glycosyltransferase involved in cell wall biosynthesis